MDYIELYKARLNRYGETTKERAKNRSKVDFEHYLERSTNAERELYNDNTGERFFGIILDHKQSPSTLRKKLKVSLDAPVEIGSVITWEDSHWIVYQKEKRSFEPFLVFLITRCNYEIKWVNQAGIVETAWAHFVSSEDSKVKENFRTWHSLITPQSNKYGEFLLSSRAIDRYTRFIIEDEAWYVIEIDKSSVPGVIYLSVGEDKINSLTDDIKNDLADIDKLNTFEIKFSSGDMVVAAGQLVSPLFDIYKNGKIVEEDYRIRVSGNLDYDGDAIYAKEAGHGVITVTLQNGVSASIQVSITDAALPEGIISGNDKIKLDRVGKYTFSMISGDDSLPQDIVWTVSDQTLVKIIETDDNVCAIRANKNNLLGTFDLCATVNDVTYFKTISVVPLW